MRFAATSLLALATATTTLAQVGKQQLPERRDYSPVDCKHDKDVGEFRIVAGLASFCSSVLPITTVTTTVSSTELHTRTVTVPKRTTTTTRVGGPKGGTQTVTTRTTTTTTSASTTVTVCGTSAPVTVKVRGVEQSSPSCADYPARFRNFECARIPGLCKCLQLATPTKTVTKTISETCTVTTHAVITSTVHIAATTTTTQTRTKTSAVAVLTTTVYPDFSRDPANCGGCGIACPADQFCAAGACSSCTEASFCGNPVTCIDGGASNCYCVRGTSGRLVCGHDGGCSDCTDDSGCPGGVCETVSCCEIGACFYTNGGLCNNPQTPTRLLRYRTSPTRGSSFERGAGKKRSV